MNSSRKPLKNSRIFGKGTDTRNIRKFSNSKYPHPPKETQGVEALDASENKEKSLLDWLKDILVRLPKCEKALTCLLKIKKIQKLHKMIYLFSMVQGDSPPMQKLSVKEI